MMMTDEELGVAYQPIVHFDRAETIPLRAVGYTVMRESGASPSFDRRVTVPCDAECVIEYPYYWDYDIQHMYDLEHIWVAAGRDGRVLRAEASFHGRYFVLWEPGLPNALPPEGGHVHAFCQPGKHAFLPDGQLFRLLPDWREACGAAAGGGVLVGGPFEGAYRPTEAENGMSERYIRKALTFAPTLIFDRPAPDGVPLTPWSELREAIPGWIRAEVRRIAGLGDCSTAQP